MGRILFMATAVVLGAGCGAAPTTTGSDAESVVSNGKSIATSTQPPVLAFDDETSETSVVVVEAPPGKGMSERTVVIEIDQSPTSTVPPPPGKGLDPVED